MGLTKWNDILNKPKGIDNIEEIALDVSQLSASVLSISQDVGEIALDVSQLSASVLSIAEMVEEETYTITNEQEDKINISRASVKKIGKVVYFEFSISVKAGQTVTSATKVLSGLPGPAIITDINFFELGASAINKPMYITTDGEIYTRLNIEETQTIGCSGSYVIN